MRQAKTAPRRAVSPPLSTKADDVNSDLHPLAVRGFCAFDARVMTADTPSPRTPTIHPLGLDGLLVRMAAQFTPEANARVAALHADLSRTPPVGFVESAPALASLHLRFNRLLTDRQSFAREIEERLEGLRHVAPQVRRIWHVPAHFGGDAAPQLAETASLAGQRPEALIAELCGLELRVLAIGFAPGQPYLGTLPPHWDIPRQSALTGQVPAGAITTAIRQIVLFGNPSPTGWRQIGRCAFRPFRPEAEVPFVLRPGDMMRFHAIGRAELAALEAARDPDGGARLEQRA